MTRVPEQLIAVQLHGDHLGAYQKVKFPFHEDVWCRRPVTDSADRVITAD